MSNRKILRDNSITDIVHLMDGKEPRQNPEGQREIFFYRFRMQTLVDDFLVSTIGELINRQGLTEFSGICRERLYETNVFYRPGREANEIGDLGEELHSHYKCVNATEDEWERVKAGDTELINQYREIARGVHLSICQSLLRKDSKVFAIKELLSQFEEEESVKNYLKYTDILGEI